MFNRAIAFYVLSSSIALCSTARMNVTVCNQGQFPQWVVGSAEREVASTYKSIDVEVVWTDCDTEPAPQPPQGVRSFTIRLRSDAPPRRAGPASLDTMGRAYISAEGRGYLADAYYRAIESMAEATTDTSDAPALLGYVIAHELGHLLLGPGHVPGGIMRPVWKHGDLESVRKRWLKFSSAQSVQIRRALQAKN